MSFASADKPDCTITRREINDEDTLVCTANGNPAKVNNICYCWKMAKMNKKEKMKKNINKQKHLYAFG